MDYCHTIDRVEMLTERLKDVSKLPLADREALLMKNL